MLRKLAVAVLHLSMLALVCAIGTYWAIRILTPPPASVPPPPPPAAMREADPMLAARMFGLVQAAAPAPSAMDIQALGAFAAGRDSAAVLAVDGKPARVYLLNQELPRGARLVEVRRDAVVVEQGGARREVALPPLQALGLGGSPPPPGYAREGNTLTAPTVSGSGPGAAAGRQPLARSPQAPIVQPPAPAASPPPPQPVALPAQPEQAEPPSTDPTPVTGRRATPGRTSAQ